MHHGLKHRPFTQSIGKPGHHLWEGRSHLAAIEKVVLVGTLWSGLLNFDPTNGDRCRQLNPLHAVPTNSEQGFHIA